VRVTVAGDEFSLSRAAAAELRAAVGDALSRREAFCRTACERRADGAYVVERRNADATGNSVVFDDASDVRDVFDALPERFGADDVPDSVATGSRRHLLVRHFAEHPAFPCDLESRNPLAAVKAD
jgi:hypothetical protein